MDLFDHYRRLTIELCASLHASQSEFVTRIFMDNKLQDLNGNFILSKAFIDKWTQLSKTEWKALSPSTQRDIEKVVKKYFVSTVTLQAFTDLAVNRLANLLGAIKSHIVNAETTDSQFLDSLHLLIKETELSWNEEDKVLETRVTDIKEDANGN